MTPDTAVISAIIAEKMVYPKFLNAEQPHQIKSDGAVLFYSRRRPTLPHSYPCSTIGPEGLNFRVRDGNGCDPLGIATEKSVGSWFVVQGSRFKPGTLNIEL